MRVPACIPSFFFYPLSVVDYTDDSEGMNENFTVVWDGTDLTVTGYGTLYWDFAWTGLKTLTIIPEGGAISINPIAFSDKDTLETVTVNGPVDSIGGYAFENCIALGAVTVNGSINSIGDSAFFGCNALKTVTVNGSVGPIGTMAFEGCSSLETIAIESSIDSIGDSAFENCIALGAVTVNGSINSIGDSAFFGCNALKTVTVNGSVGSFGNGAFFYCMALKTVTVNGSVGLIGELAFNDCEILDTVTITGPITSIASDSFFMCIGLKTVNVFCTLDAEPGDSGYGYIAYYADTVNKFHSYSASYGWAEDGKTCTVHIACANSAEHNHDENADVTSAVKIQPTENEMGTTEYSVSGTYDGFAYSSTKDVQDIPATGRPAGLDNSILLIAVGGAIAAAALIGVALFLMRRRPSE